MKKILKDILWVIVILTIIVVIATSCSKNKTCECDITGYKQFGYKPSGGDSIFWADGDTTYTKSFTQVKRKKECYSKSYTTDFVDSIGVYYQRKNIQAECEIK